MDPIRDRARRGVQRVAWGAALPALACLTGCHGAFLGEDFESTPLPLRPVSAWPLVEVEQDPATGEESTEALGGLVYHHEDPEADAEQDAVFPFYWHARAGDEERTRVPPFYWRDVDAEGSSTTLWPLFGHYREGDQRRTSVLSEVVSVGGDEAGEQVDVSAPRGVVEYHRDGDDVDLWLLGYRGASLASWSREEGRVRGHLLPFAWYWAEAGADGDERSGEADREASSLLLTPLLISSRQGQQTTLAALPGIYHRRDGDEVHTSLLGVLADYRADGESASSGHLLGYGPVSLAHFERGAEHGSAHVFPFYWRWVSQDSATTLALPLLIRSRDTQGERTLLLPFLHVARRGADEARVDVLYPLFHWEREGPDQDHWSVLVLLARYDREDAETHDLRVLWKLFRSRRDGGRREVAFNPLFTVSRDDEQDYFSFSVLGVLYRYERRGDERTHRFLHFLKV
jgi:hypothetical protein